MIISEFFKKMAFEEYKQSHTDIKKIFEFDPVSWIGKTIELCGWVKTCRVQGGEGNKLAFIKLADGSCLMHLQLLFDCKKVNQGYFDDVYKKVNTGSCLRAKGTIVASPAKGQTIEMQVTEYEILGGVEDPETYPISKNELSMEFLRTVPHLRIRTDTHSSIQRVKSTVRFAMTEYFRKLGIHEVQSVEITDNECEGGSDPLICTSLLSDGKISSLPTKQGDSDKDLIDFSLDFFRKKVFLTVSSQLHLETMILGGLSKAWCMTTAFRGEKSSTTQHLAEFWMAEWEIAFCDLKQNMAIGEGVIKYCIQKVLDEHLPELLFFQEKFSKPKLIENLKMYATQPFVVSSHEECVRLMLQDQESGKIKFDVCPNYEDDLTKQHEKYITDVLYGGRPVFVRYFPFAVKSFYMKIVDSSSEILKADCVDLLMPSVGEILGGSMREWNYGKLLDQMKKKGIPTDSMPFYTDQRKFGTCPHGGAGLGFDRLIMLITGIPSIRDAVPYPRAYQVCEC